MHDVLIAAAAGLGTGLSLIVAIGAQNAFVLRQGIRRRHVPVIVAICAGSDAVLIALGVAGIGSVVHAWPAAITALAWIGGAFLVGYGLLAARRALRSARLDPTADTAPSLRAAVLTCLALTWLNPHVYLDTVLLLGSIAGSYGSQRWAFGAGAAVASLCWFGALGFGARLLERFFARPASWRILDALIAAMMTTLGALMVASHP
ncbi:L-lysine exporter family protein LysE/ArgO [Kitasatospora sp. GAS204A]|uniref:LysE/ArgO family amino acid transporter n=1 Tax=unclassified Kitasatospora TaxID=2633591 RepID=UPI002476D675|nr:LysE/ArgO family amino acid transporter [Kitasatospora sp. GAS204B]MDH6120836.1 L-lysine exporter family protein LysE/ArgO [Kitasatospora sp. GAS204B]